MNRNVPMMNTMRGIDLGCSFEVAGSISTSAA